MDGAVYAIDVTTAEFDYLSPAFEQLTGYSLEDVRAAGGRVRFLDRVVTGEMRDAGHLLGSIEASDAKREGTSFYWLRRADGTVLRVSDEWRVVTRDDREIIQGVIRAVDGSDGRNKEELARLTDSQVVQVWRQKALLHVNDAVQGMRLTDHIESVCGVIWDEIRGAGVDLAGFVIHRVIDEETGECESYRRKGDGTFEVTRARMDLIVEIWRSQAPIYYGTTDSYEFLESVEASYGGPIESILNLPLRDGAVAFLSRRPKDFSDDKRIFVQDVADILSLGLTRFGDLAEIRRQAESAETTAREQRGLLTVSRAIHAMRTTNDLERVCRAIWDEVKLIGINIVGLSIHRVVSPERNEVTTHRLSKANYWVRTKERANLTDIWRDHRVEYEPSPEKMEAHEAIQRTFDATVGSCLNLPLEVGLVGFTSGTPEDFDEARIETLKGFADILSVGLARFNDLLELDERADEADRRANRQAALVTISDAVQRMRVSDDVRYVAVALLEALDSIDMPVAGIVIHRLLDGDRGAFRSYRYSRGSGFSRKDQQIDLVRDLWREKRVVQYGHLPSELPELVDHMAIRYGQEIRSVVNVPTLRGVIGVSSEERDAFDDSDVEFIREVGDIVSVGLTRLDDIDAIERRDREREREVRQQTTLITVGRAAQAMKRTDDAESVAQVLMDELRNLGIPVGGLILQRAVPGSPGVFQSYRVRLDGTYDAPIAPRPFLEQIWDEGEVVCVSDAEEAPWQAIVSKNLGVEVKSAVHLPFESGVLAVFSEEADAFDEETVSFLDRVRESVAVAVTRINDLEQIEKRAARQERALAERDVLLSTSKAIQAMDRPNDLPTVGRRMFEGLRGIGFRTSRLAMHRILDASEALVASTVVTEERVHQWETNRPPVLSFWKEGKTVYIPDIEDPEWESIRQGDIGTRSLLVVPYAHGVLYLHSKEVDAWNEEQVAFVAQVAEMLSVGVSRMIDMETLSRRNAEIEASESRFRELFESANDAVYTHDLQGRFTSMNRAGEHLTGYTRDELVGQSYEMLLTAESVEIAKRKVAQKVDDPTRPTRYETEIIRKDGRRVPIEISSSILMTDGSPSAILGVARDVSERRETERELVRIQRLNAIGELAAGVSHNLNNMLTGVLGPAQMIQRFTKDARTREEADAIARNALRAAELVQRLNQSVRGTEIERARAVDLNRACLEAIKAARPRWKDETESKGLQVVIEDRLATPPPLVQATETGLNDVLINLIFNAVDALPEGGTIRVETERRADRVVLRVSDTGTSMPPHIRDRIFEPFFTTKADVGTGLGLSTVYASLKSWGGDAEVESKEGAGTTFELTFQPQEGSSVETVPETPSTVSTRAGRLLVVDDNESVRELVRAVAETGGSAVATFDNGTDALETVKPGFYHVALIDLSMPGMPGDQLASKIRARDPHIALVLMSGWTLDPDDERGLPFDHQIQKPFADLHDLESAIASGLELQVKRSAS